VKRRLLHRLELEAEKSNMSVSVQKTQSLVTGNRDKLMVYNKNNIEVMTFKYLGAEHYKE